MLRYLLVTLFVLVIAGCDSNSAATNDFTRVVITEVNVESWPIRKPNGDRWDGFPTENPDIYFDIVDSGGQLIFTTEDDDESDVGDNDIGPQWQPDIQFNNFNRTLHFEIWDSDSNDDDFMGETESFSLMDLADRGFLTFVSVQSMDQVTIVTARLQWER